MAAATATVTAPFSSSLITRRCLSSPLLRIGFSTPAAFFSLKRVPSLSLPLPLHVCAFVVRLCSASHGVAEFDKPTTTHDELLSKQGPLKPGLYLVGTPIGNLEDITLRALRVLKSSDVILAEDTRHSGKLLHYYGIKTPLVSYHKFNESMRERTVLQRLKQGQVVALISDAGMPGISDPGTELVKLCAEENITVVPVPGPSAVLTALAGAGLPTEEFTFVGFLRKHAGSRREQLSLLANQRETLVFFVPPHRLLQFLEEASSIFGGTRRCVVARELTKIHEEFWRGILEEAKVVFTNRKPKGEITVLVEGKVKCTHKSLSESEIEDELKDLISAGHNLSMAVKLVAKGFSMNRKEVYSLALKKFGKQHEEVD